MSPGCRTCRTCRTLSDTVRPLSDADCRTAVGLTVGLSGTVGPLRVRQHDRALSDTVRLLSDYCRTLSDAVGRCRTLSDAVGRCQTVGLSDCRTTVGDYCRTVKDCGNTLHNLSDFDLALYTVRCRHSTYSCTRYDGTCSVATLVLRSSALLRRVAVVVI